MKVVSVHNHISHHNHSVLVVSIVKVFLIRARIWNSEQLSSFEHIVTPADFSCPHADPS